MSENLNSSVKSGPPSSKLVIENWLGRYGIGVVFANLMVLVFAGALLWASWKLGNDNAQSFTINILLCLLGASLGWGIGILATPIASDDTSHFAKLGQIISAFVGGYLVSKLDRYLEHALYSDTQLIPIAWARFCLFAVSFLVSLIAVFTNRWYLHRFILKPLGDQASAKGTYE